MISGHYSGLYPPKHASLQQEDLSNQELIEIYAKFIILCLKNVIFYKDVYAPCQLPQTT